MDEMADTTAAASIATGETAAAPPEGAPVIEAGPLLEALHDVSASHTEQLTAHGEQLVGHAAAIEQLQQDVAALKAAPPAAPPAPAPAAPGPTAAPATAADASKKTVAQLWKELGQTHRGTPEHDKAYAALKAAGAIR